MNRPLTRIVPIFVAIAATLGLQAQTTGRIMGKVLNKKGEPIPAAVVIIKRVDISWTKTLAVDAKGGFIQVGLEPKEFTLAVTCAGYVDFLKKVKIPLNEVLVEAVTMMTPQENLAEAKASGKVPTDDAGVVAENEGTEAANQAFAFYKEQNYAAAQPLLETAQIKFKESIEKAKDEKVKATLEENLSTAERVLGIVTANNLAANPGKVELAGKAQPLLEKALAKKPDDLFALQAIMEVAKAKKDTALEKKYKSALDKLVGPKPELAYNDAVAAFNAGKAKEAKEHLLKAIQIDPKFSESYYLLGMVEYGNMNLKACKEGLLKYLELDPTGKKAAEVKEMLNDPSLKKIK
jgi:tetratricopeptide (TPR) repeat protein